MPEYEEARTQIQDALQEAGVKAAAASGLQNEAAAEMSDFGDEFEGFQRLVGRVITTVEKGLTEAYDTMQRSNGETETHLLQASRRLADVMSSAAGQEVAEVRDMAHDALREHSDQFQGLPDMEPIRLAVEGVVAQLKIKKAQVDAMASRSEALGTRLRETSQFAKQKGENLR